MKNLWKTRNRLLALVMVLLILLGIGICASAEEVKESETTEQVATPEQTSETSQTEEAEQENETETTEETEKTEETEEDKTETEEVKKETEEEETEEPLSDYQQMQINLISSKLGEFLQEDNLNTWYYCVMDLDRNGRLEFAAADQHPVNRATNLKIWEVNPDTTGLMECVVEKEADESFPDIISNSADTYYDYNKDRWSYLFYDNVVLSPVEVYTVRCSVSMREGIIGYQAYAVEHSELVDSYRYVSHMDMSGNPISADQYNAAGARSLDEAERSTTNFDWFTAKEVVTPERLSASCKVFYNLKPAPAGSPIIPPPVMQHDALTPLQGTAGETDAVYMVITKNPTSEKKKVGESLSFVTSANVYDSAYWTFVDPNGNEFDLDYFAAHHVYSYIDGYYEPTLTIRNLDEYMDGWGAYCTYSFKGQTAVTSTAWMTVKPA